MKASRATLSLVLVIAAHAGCSGSGAGSGFGGGASGTGGNGGVAGSGGSGVGSTAGSGASAGSNPGSGGSGLGGATCVIKPSTGTHFDPAFPGGYRDLPLPPSVTYLSDLGLRRDHAGRFVVFGRALGAGIFIARFLESGELDATFANGGVGIYQPAPYAQAFDLDVDPQGAIYVAGTIAPKAPATQALLMRLTPSGDLDVGFTGVGYISWGMVYDWSDARAVLAQSDGVVVGTQQVSSAPIQGILDKRTGSGLDDPGFISVPESTGSVYDALADGSGSIFASIYGSVHKYAANGVPDSQFVPSNKQAGATRRLIPTSDGGVLVLASAGAYLLSATGARTDFQSTGTYLMPFDAAVRCDGSLVIVGNSTDNKPAYAIVNGTTLSPIVLDEPILDAVSLVASDGTVIVAKEAGPDLELYRYTPSGVDPR